MLSAVVGSRRAALGGLLLVVTGCYTGLPEPAGDDAHDEATDGVGEGTQGQSDGDDGGLDDGLDDDGVGDDGIDGGGVDDGGDDGAPGGSDGDAGGDDASPSSDDAGALDDGATATEGDTGDPGDGDTGDGGSAEGGTDDGAPDPVCGNGAVEPGEACDDGNGNDDDTCSNDCEMQIPSDLPDNAYCDAVAGWSQPWMDLEAQVITLVNQKRAQVIDCGGGNVLGPSPPVSYDPALTCAARNHSKDMGENGFFSHTNLQGQGPSQRLMLAGYTWSTWGENIAAGYGTAQQVVDGWIDSQGHCVNLMNPAFTELGVGYFNGAGSEYGHYWTQNFGTPP
jgi:cysteine-rich repeat protein